MSDTRTTTLQIKAETSGFRNGLRTARKGLEDFNNEVQKSAAKRQAILGVGTALGKMGLLAAGGAALAIRAYANFDQAMSAVKATGKDARKSQDALRQAAIDAGQATQFNATESANAIENLAKAGISAADILGGGLKGSLDLAAAGGLDVASAAEIAAVALTQFKLKGADVPHVADLLAAGAGKANGEVTDLAQALNQSGLVAAQMGLSIEETTGSLAAFASAGLLGSDAGTSLKTMLLRLQNPSQESAALMKKLGISAYDASGNFVGMADLSGQLATAFDGQKQSTRDAAMAQIFGSDAIRAANVLYNEGAKGIDGWTKKVNDAGYASETAATKMDNLKGDWEQLTGSLETALIGTGAGADGPLRGLLQNVTSLINAYNGLSDSMQSGVLTTLAVTAAIGGSAFVISRAIVGYANMRNALVALGITQTAVSRTSMLMRGGALAAGAGLLAVSGKAGQTNSALGSLAKVGGATALGFAVGGPWGAALAGGGMALWELGKKATSSGDDLKLTSLSADALAGSLDGVTGAATAATAALVFKDLSSSGIMGQATNFGIASRDVVAAALGQKDAIDRVHLALQEYTGTDLKGVQDIESALGMVSAKYADQKAKIQDTTRAATSWSEALKGVPLTVQTELKNLNYQPTLNQVANLSQKYKLTPKTISTMMRALDFATPDINAVLRALRNADGKRAEVILTTRQRTIKETFNINYDNGVGNTLIAPKKKADGGFITGPGTARSDSIPAMLSNGEFVVNAAATAKNLGLLHSINAQRFANGGIAGQSSTDKLTIYSTAAGKTRKDELKAESDALKKTLADTKKSFDGFKSKLDDARNAMKSYADEVSSKFKSDPFNQGNDGMDGNPFYSGLAGFGATVAKDTEDAKAMKSALSVLKKKGLDGALFKDLAASGDVLMARDLATKDKSTVDYYEKAYQARDIAATSVGSYAGTAAFGKQIAELTKTVASLHKQVQRVTIEERDVSRLASQIGGAVSSGLKSSASSSQHGSSNKPRG